MRSVLLLLPAGLSLLALGAHFLRRGQTLAVATCLALLAMLSLLSIFAFELPALRPRLASPGPGAPDPETTARTP